jgi:phage shock protein E
MQRPTISCDAARELVANGALLVDVRDPHEYRRGALPGAVNIPLPAIQESLHRLDKSVPVLLYCATGRRSDMAKRLLEASGHSSLHNIGSQAFFNNCAPAGG